MSTTTTDTWATLKGVQAGDSIAKAQHNSDPKTGPGEYHVITDIARGQGATTVTLDNAEVWSAGTATKYFVRLADRPEAPAKAPRTRKVLTNEGGATVLTFEPVAAKKAAKAAAKAAPAPAVDGARKPAARADVNLITETNLVGFPVTIGYIPEALAHLVGTQLDGHDGYYVRVPRSTYVIAARMDDVVGSNWLVRCEHGTVKAADGLLGDEGAEKTAARRSEWCDACATRKASAGTSTTPSGSIAKRRAHDAVAALIRAHADNRSSALYDLADKTDLDEAGMDRLADAFAALADYHAKLGAK